MPVSVATLRRACALLVLIAVAGCTSIRPAIPPEQATQRAALLAMQTWEARGRIAFRSGEEGGQASLRWQQAGERSLIRLAGPFGAGAYDVSWEPERVSVTDADGEQSIEYRGATAAEQFLQAQLGWSFPAGSTRYWMMGLLDPAADGEEQWAEDGTLLEIRQHGWTVRFERFQDVQGYALPVRLELENANASLGLVITRWTLQPAGGL
jgi:outer membrane lipoprotein LolB